MTPTRKRRLILISLVIMGVAVATAIFLTAFKDNIMFFKSPTEISQNDFPVNRSFRLGGMVKEGSLQRLENSLKVQFEVTDYGADVQVERFTCEEDARESELIQSTIVKIIERTDVKTVLEIEGVTIL